MQSKVLRESYWHAPYKQPLRWATIPQYIDHWAEKSPQEEAYVVRMNGHPREAVTFAELKEKTEAIAAGLLQLGLAPGDFVMITGITCMNWILVDLACASIGVPTIRCSMSNLTKEGLHHIANTHSVRALFYHPGETGELHRHLSKCIPEAFQGKQCDTIPSLRHVISLAAADGMTTVQDLTSKHRSLDAMRAIRAKVDPESILTVFMTSGSTGFPKAIPYSHFPMVNAMLMLQEGVFGMMRADDRFFSDRSLAWVGSLIHMPLIIGNCCVFMHPLNSALDNDVDFLIQMMHDEKITCGLVLKFHIGDISTRLEAGCAKPFKLRFAATGGEMIGMETLEKLKQFCGEPFLLYGASEVFIISNVALASQTKENLMYTGVYRVYGATEVKIVDRNGRVVPLGCEGEIVVRSAVAFRGYMQKEASGMLVDALGWIHTGDAGSLHDGGLLRVLGRKSDEISRGARFIHPSLVEATIARFPGVEEVAVIGVPDARLGQDICACIIPQAGTALREEDMRRCFDDLYQTDEGMGITPGYFLFLEQFPVVNGKTDRKKLLRMAMEKFGISA